MNKYFGKRTVSFSVLFLLFFSASAQVNTVEFGKNRVQYQKFNWKYYQSENFNTYFSQDGLELGKYVAQVAEKVTAARRKAEARGRSLSFGIRLHFIVRETEDEAWREAERLISKVSDSQIAAAQARFTQQMDSVGQRRMAELHGGDRNRLLVAPNLWAGVGLVRNGAGTALVGTPEQVAARLREYQAVGVDLVIGSGYPHLEEAYRVAELLFPALGLGGRHNSLVETVSNEFAVGFHGKAQVAI